MAFILESAVYSNTGNVRNNNEDNYYLDGAYISNSNHGNSKDCKTVETRQAVLAVCDGMGGEADGEIASLMAVEGIRKVRVQSPYTEITDQVLAINRQICDEMKKKKLQMGSTFSALYIENERVVSCNVGDSRVYQIKKGVFRQLSQDHDEATRMVNMGLMTKEAAETSSKRHVLTQYFGVMEEDFQLQPYYSQEMPLEGGDKFLLCSDGLSDMVSDRDIERILQQNKNAQELAEELVEAALQNGGKDNVTVMVAIAQKTETQMQDSVQLQPLKPIVEPYVRNAPLPMVRDMEVKPESAPPLPPDYYGKKDGWKKYLLCAVLLLLGILIGVFVSEVIRQRNDRDAEETILEEIYDEDEFYEEDEFYDDEFDEDMDEYDESELPNEEESMPIETEREDTDSLSENHLSNYE